MKRIIIAVIVVCLLAPQGAAAEYLKQSTAAAISLGPFVAPADGVTAVTSLAGTGSGQLENTSTGIKLSKNGGALTVRHATATASTYDSFGNYIVTLDTTDTNTLGLLRVQYYDPATTCPVWQDFMVVNANVYASLLTPGTTYLKVDITKFLTADPDTTSGVNLADASIKAATYDGSTAFPQTAAVPAVNTTQLAGDVVQEVGGYARTIPETNRIWFVNPSTGNNSNVGTRTAPLQTFAAAQTAASEGDTIRYLAGGTLPAITISKSLTVIGTSDGLVNFTGSGNGITIACAAPRRIELIDIKGTSTSDAAAWGCQSTGDSPTWLEAFTATNCVFTGHTGGLSIIGCRSLRMTDCDCVATGPASGIYGAIGGFLESSQSVVCDGCRFSATATAGTGSVSGLQTYGTFDSVFTNCRFEGLNTTANSFGAQGISFAGDDSSLSPTGIVEGVKPRFVNCVFWAHATNGGQTGKVECAVGASSIPCYLDVDGGRFDFQNGGSGTGYHVHLNNASSTAKLRATNVDVAKIDAGVQVIDSDIASIGHALPTAVPGTAGGLLIDGSNAGTVTLADGLLINRSSSNATALTLSGNGSGRGALIQGGATGGGARIAAGSSAPGAAFAIAAGTSGSGLSITGTGTGGQAGSAVLIDGSAGTGDGIYIVGATKDIDCAGTGVSEATINKLAAAFTGTGGASGVFSTPAMANAPTGGTGLTAQQTADALKLAPTAGAPAANSVYAAIAGVAAGSGLTAQQTRDAMKLAPSGGAAAGGSIDSLIAGVEQASSFATDWANAFTTATSGAPTVANELTNLGYTAGRATKLDNLDQAVSSAGVGLTAQQTRDAMKLAPTSGAPASGSIDSVVASLDSMISGNAFSSAALINAPAGGGGGTFVASQDNTKVIPAKTYRLGTRADGISEAVPHCKLRIGESGPVWLDTTAIAGGQWCTSVTNLATSAAALVASKPGVNRELAVIWLDATGAQAGSYTVTANVNVGQQVIKASLTVDVQ